MTTQAPPSGSRAAGYAKGRATREEILDAAMQLFGEVGYHTASLREVASRVGISHPGLLHHFPSKAALLAAVLERRDEIDGELFAADDSGGDYFESLVTIVERNAARPGIVELFATLSAEATSTDHPAHAYFQERYRGLVARLASGLGRRRDDGRLRPGVDPLTGARLTVAVMDGMQIQWLLAADTPDTRPDMAAALRAHLSTLLTD